MSDGRLDAEYHLRTIDTLGDGVGDVEVYQEPDGKMAALWGTESTYDAAHVRRLARALLEAADTMELSI